MKVVELLPYSQMLHGTPGGMLGNLQQAHNRSQQLPGLMQVIIVVESISYFVFILSILVLLFGSVLHGKQDIKSEMMNPRAAGPEGSLIGVHGIDLYVSSTENNWIRFGYET